MKKEFQDYLESMDFSKVLRDTIEKKHDTLVAFCGVADFDDIFISEAKSNSGDKEYFSLWAFTNKHLCKISITRDEVVIFRWKGFLSTISCEDWQYDFKKANANSVLRVVARRMDAERPLRFNSTGMNVDVLNKILKKYILPNIEP